jgi:DNA-binding HxlR family transcriptional regulator
MESMDATTAAAIATRTPGGDLSEVEYPLPTAPYELAGRPYWCPVNLAIDALTGRWKTLIVWQLVQNGTVRYGGLKREVRGITHKMLAQSLRELEADGLIVRRVFAVVPPHVEYSLSDAGHALIPVLRAMEVFGSRYAVAMAEAPGASSSD